MWSVFAKKMSSDVLKTNICKRNHELGNTFHRKKTKIFVSNLPTQLKKNCAILPMSNYSAIYFAFIPYLHFCICCQVESSSRIRFRYLLHSVNVNMEPNLNSVFFIVKLEKNTWWWFCVQISHQEFLHFLIY